MAEGCCCHVNETALWQHVLPQVLCSLRNPREHGTSLFPIFNAPNRTDKKCWILLPKSPSLSRTSERAAGCVHASIRRVCGHCPRSWGAFPVVWAAIFISLFSTLLQQPPKIGSCPEALCLLSVCVWECVCMFLNIISGHHIILSEIIGWAKDWKSQVNRQCESSHGAAGRHVGRGGWESPAWFVGPQAPPLWHHHCLRLKAWDFPYIHLAVLAVPLIRE